MPPHGPFLDPTVMGVACSVVVELGEGVLGASLVGSCR